MRAACGSRIGMCGYRSVPSDVLVVSLAAVDAVCVVYEKVTLKTVVVV